MKTAEINQEEILKLVNHFTKLKEEGKYIMSPSTIMLAVKKKEPSKVFLTEEQKKKIDVNVTDVSLVVVTVGETVKWLGVGDKVLISPQYNLLAYAIPIPIQEFDKYNFWVVEPGSSVSLILERWKIKT